MAGERIPNQPRHYWGKTPVKVSPSSEGKEYWHVEMLEDFPEYNPLLRRHGNSIRYRKRGTAELVKARITTYPVELTDMGYPYDQ